MSDLLPGGFEGLAPFARNWAVAGTAARAALRDRASAEERQAFYSAIAPRAAEALDYLDQRPWGQFSPAEQRLLNMMLAFAHISIAEEVQREDEERHAAARPYMVITRSPGDAAPGETTAG